MRKTICLGDMATYINGYAFKPVDWGTKGLPIIRIQNLTDSGKDYNYYDGEVKERYLVKKGDVLISWSASIGVFEWEKEDAWLNQHIFKVVFDKGDVDKQYFKYVTGYVLKKSLQYAHGSTMKHLTKSTFDKLPIPIYDLKEQRVIAEKIGKVDEAIAECDAMLADFDLLVKSRFVEMFGTGEFPSVKLKDVCSKITDGTHKTPVYLSEGIPFVSAKNIKDGKLVFDDIKYISEQECAEIQKRCQITAGDILLTKSGSLGMPALVDVDFPFGVFESLAVLKYDRERLNGAYLHSQINSDDFQHRLLSGVKGIAVKHLHLNVIGATEIILPPMELQNQFADFVALTDKSKHAVQQSLDTLQTLKAKLMQDYFS